MEKKIMFIGKIRFKDKHGNIYTASVYSSNIGCTTLNNQYRSEEIGMYDYILEDGTSLSINHKDGTITNIHGEILEPVDYI